MKNKKLSAGKTILLFIVCSLATIYFFKWIAGPADAEYQPTQEEIYISTLEAKLAQVGADWQSNADFVASNLNEIELYKALNKNNLKAMDQLNKEANSLRNLLGIDFQPSVISEN